MKLGILVILGVLFCAGFVSSNELTPVKVQLNWYDEVEFAGYYAAIEQGYYESEGLEVELIERKEEKSCRYVADGKADFGVTDFSDMIISISEGCTVKMIGAMYQKHPGVIFTHKEDNIEIIENLEGKKIGAKNIGWKDKIGRALNNAGVNAELVDVENDINLFYNKEVDVWAGYAWDEPSEAELEGYPNNVIYLSDYGVGSYAGIVVTHEDTIENNPELVEKFLKATL